MTNTVVQEITLAIREYGALTIDELAAKTEINKWEITSSLLKMFTAGLADCDAAGCWLVVGGGLKL